MGTLTAAISPQLPYLRRYARALTGSQSNGDTLVAAVLEAIIADLSIFPEASSPRVGLYRLLARTYAAIASPAIPAEPRLDWERKAVENLSALTPPQRQAFLLVAVEGFSSEEGAEVLNVSVDEFEALRASASEELARQLATDVLIIEDELMIAMDIEQIVESLGHRVVGIARTRSEANELMRSADPKLVLADIHLADGSSGIDAVNDIVAMSPVPVIFITAFPERLLTGQRPEPTFLVTKPFMPEMIKALIGQALFFDRQARKAA